MAQLNYTTPLERAILQHYWCYPTRWKGGKNLWSVSDRNAIARFLDLGLLRVRDRSIGPREDDLSTVEANPDALRPYMDALAAVPLPVQVNQWIIPDQGGAG